LLTFFWEAGDMETRLWKRFAQLALLSLASAAVIPAGSVLAHDDHGRVVVMRDDCDPNDPAWAPTGGCTRKNGQVTFAEFAGELDSPLAASVIGHQAWRNEPSYLEIEGRDALIARNRGGRVHTFTEVANFGGGRVPLLNEGLVPAPECATATDVPPDHQVTVGPLSEGNHRFQCCIHPWMRALVKVKPD
jgi:hypothetical protein